MTATQNLMDRNASEHPALRKAVAQVIATTTLADALAGDQKRQLTTDLLDAGSSPFALADVLIAAGAEDDYADEVARKLSDAILETALNL